jgi:nucleoid-associated protein YgaU
VNNKSVSKKKVTKLGVFDFIREAGAKIGIGDSQAEQDAKASAASAERAAEMAKRVRERKAEMAKAARAEKLDDSKKARGLEGYVKNLGFDVEDLDIRYSDGLATIDGKVKDQETKERIILAVGNVDGVGTVDENLKVAEAGAEADLHVVVSGDTLSKIAKEVYGDAMKYPVIFEANRPMLTDPDKIYVGQVLRIPKIS